MPIRLCGAAAQQATRSSPCPREGFKHRIIDELWRVKAATSARSIGTAIASDTVIEQIRKELRRQTGHNMDPAELRDLIKSSVLRPDAYRPPPATVPDRPLPRRVCQIRARSSGR
jgi:hypothetical protein